MNQGIYGLTRADGGDPSRVFATTADAQAGLANRLIATPQSLPAAILTWITFGYGSQSVANGATFTPAVGGNYWTFNTTTTTNGTIVVSSGTPAGSYLMQGLYSGQAASAKNWGIPQSMFIRLARHTSAANSVFRLQWGEKASIGTFAQISGRGIGVEIRDARLWIIAHNGSALTQYDTGIDVNGGQGNSAVPFDLLITSNQGTVSVAYSNAGTTVIASTTGGPVAIGSSTSAPTVEFTNGASATACTFFSITPRHTYQ